MFTYVLPGVGIHGGVKKGFHCAELLSRSGHPCRVATPDGSSATWFDAPAPVVSHAEVVRRCRDDDAILFSCPADAPFVDRLPARRKILHMQGANTADDHALLDPARGYELVSHGLHMTLEVLRHGRVAPYVPIGVPEVFRWSGEAKRPLTVAVMPRKGAPVLARLRAALGDALHFVELDGLPERAVAARLRECDLFAAISVDEAFGLPPLEAMCARCCVVGFPGVGGFEFLRHGETAHVVPNGDVDGLVAALRALAADPERRDGLRDRGAAFTAYYTLEREREYLLRALGLEDRARRGSPM